MKHLGRLPGNNFSMYKINQNDHAINNNKITIKINQKLHEYIIHKQRYTLHK